MIKVIRLSGILDSINGNHLRQEINEAIGTGSKIILVDCQSVTFMDSSGLGALVIALKRVNEAGGKFSICSINDQIKMLLELTSMERTFNIFANQNEFNQAIAKSNIQSKSH